MSNVASSLKETVKQNKSAQKETIVSVGVDPETHCDTPFYLCVVTSVIKAKKKRRVCLVTYQQSLSSHITQNIHIILTDILLHIKYRWGKDDHTGGLNKTIGT